MLVTSSPSGEEWGGLPRRLLSSYGPVLRRAPEVRRLLASMVGEGSWEWSGGVPSGVGCVYGEVVGAMTSSALRAPSPGRRREV